MGVAKTVISVAIIGDAKKLIGALGKADAATGGLLSSAGKILVAGKVVQEGFQFIGDSLHEADRLGDALQRLNVQVGPEFAKRIDDAATAFINLGLSRQDVDELAASFADIGTAIGLTDNQIANFAVTAAGTAQALQLLGKGDAATLLDQIAKAAGGSEKAAKALGVTLLANVDANTQLSNILFQLNPQLVAATTGTGDLEQHQTALQARVETLQASLGEKLAPALADVLQFINDEIDAIPHAIAGFEMLGAAIEGFGRNVLGPLGNVRDVLADIVGLFTNARTQSTGQIGGSRIGGTISDSSIAGSTIRTADRNGTVLDRIGGP